MNIDHIDDATVISLQVRRSGLRHKQRCFQVSANQVIKLLFRHACQRCGVKG